MPRGVRFRATELRAATTDDLPAIGALLRQLGYDIAAEAVRRRLALVMAAPDHGIWVGQRSGRLVGLLHLYVSSPGKAAGSGHPGPGGG